MCELSVFLLHIYYLWVFGLLFKQNHLFYLWRLIKNISQHEVQTTQPVKHCLLQPKLLADANLQNVVVP